uniref:Putative odorant receptor 92a n=1 Tax=Drosophila melanogaster TaxID=7227 RepID=OR92A_DROME|nr:odorant receptor 92a [Drosophila melanogaster]Q9VDM1.3 RecName: Full=Putative odorant receptor 92a [Drosophila melanogaster]AAF55769.2 odorant receptor 92a [Drosophila melanogaster]|eukprot:NP_524414.2 odorant receptor 92a [Drosophila melanogaster]
MLFRKRKPKSDDEVITFDELTRFPMTFYKTIGEDLYSDRDPNVIRRYLLRFYLVLGFLNFNAYVVGEIAYFIVHIMSTTTLLEATAVAPCIGFSFMADFKQFGLTVNRKRLVRLLDDLKEIFPLDLEAQRKYNVSFYRKHMNRVMTLFTILCMTYTSSFSFYPAIKSTIKYYLMGSEIFERNYGFHILFPYDAETDLTVYWFSYWGLAHCAYVAGVSYVCVDLLLIATITQLTMHFNFIANDLEAYEGGDHTDEENIKYLHNLVVYHARALDLSEEVNNIFSFLILWNFIAASLVICFAGFQITASNVEDIVLYFIFFSASLVQVFVVCYYGDEMISSSSRIGHSAFNQNWLPCSTKYKRILQFIIARSQKPASIRPPTFPPISFNTFMKVISMSYQFFALLRTTYYG